MYGAIRKRDVIAHPVTTIQCFGWEVFLRSLLASRDRTFLGVVGQTTLAKRVVAELPELTARGVKLELRMAELYRSLAQRFAGVEAVRNFFLDIARQEESHAELLELCHTSSGPQASAEKSLEPWREVVARLEDEIPRFAGHLKEVGDLEDVLRLVIDIESSEINDVFEGIVDASQSSFVRAVKAFTSAQAEHTELICRSIPALAPSLSEACQALREKHH